jgi:hypothetical protein
MACGFEFTWFVDEMKVDLFSRQIEPANNYTIIEMRFFLFVFVLVKI